MKTLFVYILKCADDTYYTGVTNNLERRLHEHNNQSEFQSYTSTRRPLTLAWHSAFSPPMKAIRWEKRIKGWTRKKKEALIAGRYDLLHELSECRNESHSKNYASAPISTTKQSPLSTTKQNGAQQVTLSETQLVTLNGAQLVTLSGAEE